MKKKNTVRMLFTLMIGLSMVGVGFSGTPTIDGEFDGTGVWGEPIGVANFGANTDPQEMWFDSIFVTYDADYVYFGVNVTGNDRWDGNFQVGNDCRNVLSLVVNFKSGGPASGSIDPDSMNVFYDFTNQPDLIICQPGPQPKAHSWEWSGSEWTAGDSVVSTPFFKKSGDTWNDGPIFVEVKYPKSELGGSQSIDMMVWGLEFGGTPDYTQYPVVGFSLPPTSGGVAQTAQRAYPQTGNGYEEAWSATSEQTMTAYVEDVTISEPSQIGGPYTADDNTMLLMHFDGDLSNASQYSEDGMFNGSAENFYFLANPITELNQCLRIDNDSQSDSAYVTVADTSYLDLTGDWTIEGWINIFTFGEGPDDWRWVPRLVIKPGTEVFWRPNYFVEMWGSARFFSCGYHTASQDQWPQANSPDNTMVPGQWYHLTFVRDSTRHLLMTLIHNADRELISFTVEDYLTFGADDPTPITTDEPVHIGYAGGGGDSFLDGFVDEIRISNTVRQFPVPPIVTNVTQLANQEASVAGYEVGGNVFTLFGTTIASAELYYSTGNGWQSVDMTTVSGDSMSATIPQQSSGSIVNYYVKAVDNNGLEFVYPRDAGFGAAEYYTFGIYTPQTQTLSLDFEEGSGTPVDGSSYNNPVTLEGAPEYSTEAAAGDYSMYMGGDSSYLEVDSPFLSGEEFCVDFWFRADSIEDYCRILNKPNVASQWWDNNYQIRFNDAQQLQAISDGSVTFTTDITMEREKWYHVIYEVQKAPEGDTVAYYGGFQVKDINGDELYFDYEGFDTPVILAQAPLRIGKAAGGDYPPFFTGYYDNVNLYNYPAVGLLSDIISSVKENAVPLTFELSQNYPNPFNPTTEIKYSITKKQNITLIVYDILGRKVKTLVDENMAAGIHSVKWDGTNESGIQVTSGVYFYKLKAEDKIRIRKMLMLK